ncbi:hypothetical protein [Cupriavidus taiwanensis]|uniref:Uncharacterized protein n=2 Tax=Cupriavidus taiwanensis TaxID=164546 RepID=A0A7Z7J7A8_9BURK|nr:hypothetical protein [Cupriavidus taiwanensis]SOY85575.1 conserved hypothetical protein; putative exported protein [Cupriavidus taiwanensis]SOZ04079.1 conserved hypothetical protein; putative exported protein [Cupriavidus taiwanensis]SOZ07339.1 conserved hypothetical protein; putative exported protein [Cupriavidus taiwanensis]SPC09754.1 conserved hypothetical protein; putative exported protein [Cupriavidus taiwanensis]SPD39540.1 conserved exported protein of unknown function [Cupriavidus ta
MRVAWLTELCTTLGVAAALALAGAAQAAPATELSTGPVAGAAAGGEALGLNQAIRDGEARRGAALSTGPARPLAPRPEYASLPVYVGKVGDQPVRLRLGPKPDERDSVRGEYSGRGAGVRLLAGEWDGGAFLMEESDDGTRVSGNWEGTIDASGAVRGTWTDAFNPAIVLPFFIRPLGLLVIPPFDMTPSSGVTYAPPPPKSSISGW